MADPKSLVYRGAPGRGAGVIIGNDYPTPAQAYQANKGKQARLEQIKANRREKERQATLSRLGKNAKGDLKGAWEKDLPDLRKVAGGITDLTAEYMAQGIDPTDPIKFPNAYSAVQDQYNALEDMVAQSKADKKYYTDNYKIYQKDYYDYPDSLAGTFDSFANAKLGERKQFEMIPELDFDLGKEIKSMDLKGLVIDKQTGGPTFDMTKGEIDQDLFDKTVDNFVASNPKALKYVYNNDVAKFKQETSDMIMAGLKLKDISKTKDQRDSGQKKKDDETNNRVWVVKRALGSDDAVANEALGGIVNDKVESAKIVYAPKGVVGMILSQGGLSKLEKLTAGKRYIEIVYKAGTAANPKIETFYLNPENPQAKTILNNLYGGVKAGDFLKAYDNPDSNTGDGFDPNNLNPK